MACLQKIAAALVLVSLHFFQASQGIRVVGLDGGAAAAAAPSRTEPGQCSTEAVAVYQSPGSPLPSGIPRYTVDVMNVCEGCTVSGVHLSCGEFASTELVDPAKFQRVADGDCLVKGGGELAPSEVVSFEYTNSFAYPLRVTSVSCPVE